MKSITLFAILTLASFHLSSLPASAANQQTAEKEAIFNNPKAFVEAFEKGDAKVVAAGGGYHYEGGGAYYGGGFHSGGFVAGYASGVY